MVARTFIVDIAEGPFNGIGIGTGGWSIQHREAGMSSHPLLDFLGFMQLRLIDYDGQRRKERHGVCPLERGEQLNKQPGLFALPHTMGDHTGGDVQSPSQRALLVGARGQHLALFPLGHPVIADLGQQMDIQLIGKEQGHPSPPLFERQANAGSLLHALGSIIVGSYLRPFPFPVQLRKPGAHRLR